MGAGDAAFAAHRVGDRDGVGFGEKLQRRVGEREMDAAADQQQRPLRAGDQPGGRLGIVARVRTVLKNGYRPVYTVDVSGSTQQLRFLDSIGAFGPRHEQIADPV